MDTWEFDFALCWPTTRDSAIDCVERYGDQPPPVCSTLLTLAFIAKARPGYGKTKRLRCRQSDRRASRNPPKLPAGPGSRARSATAKFFSRRSRGHPHPQPGARRGGAVGGIRISAGADSRTGTSISNQAAGPAASIMPRITSVAQSGSLRQGASAMWIRLA